MKNKFPWFRSISGLQRSVRQIGTFVIIISLLVYWFVATASSVHATVCGEDIPKDPTQITNYINDCNSRLTTLAGQKQTLSSAIDYLNTQIKLTQAKVASTTTQLDKLNVEIADLSGKIESIDYSLDDLTKLFVSRVRETYMKPGRFDTAIIAQSSGFSDILRNIEYTKKIRDHDRSILISLEKSRLDATAQKDLKEVKQAEIQSLKRKLDADKSALSGQIAAKNKLLSETKNDEAKYQQLRSSAQAQLAAFNTFVSNQGGSSIISGSTKSDSGWGTYYNQRDSQWGSQLLPGSNYTMASSGCLVTSMAMVMSYYGKSVKPGDIAGQSELFSFGDFRQGSWNIGGSNTTRTRVGYSRTSLDNELSANPGKPVIVGIIQYGSSRPEHFLVVKAKVGDDYLINDPFPEGGMSKTFTSHYPLSSIAAVDRITVN